MNVNIRSLLAKAYSGYIRPHLPEKNGTHAIANRVHVSRPNAKIFDSVIGDPTYEYFNAKALRKYVGRGDVVNVVGGGLGVTTVIAARQVDDLGKVHSFEGGTETFRTLEETVERNEVTDTVETYHAVVGGISGGLRSKPTDAETISPKELPECDVLEIDVEGSELEILRDMEIHPDVIIIEAHAHFGVPDRELEKIIKQQGYEIQSKAGNFDMVYHFLATAN